MARGNMVTITEKRFIFGFLVLSASRFDSFLDYDKIAIRKNGSLIGYWGASMNKGKPYRDMLDIHCAGFEIVRNTGSLLILKVK